MRQKDKKTSLNVRTQKTIEIEDTRRQTFWMRIGLRLAAIFLIIVFLAGECSALLPEG